MKRFIVTISEYGFVFNMLVLSILLSVAIIQRMVECLRITSEVREHRVREHSTDNAPLVHKDIPIPSCVAFGYREK